MIQLHNLVLFLLANAHVLTANVEKVLFLAPSNLQIPNEHPTLEDLQLDTLSPENSTLRTRLKAEFPTDATSWGEASWILLNNLSQGQRYEVRICWAATQPTSFRLFSYSVPEVFESVELINSLANYSKTRQPQSESLDDQKRHISKSVKISDNGVDDLKSIILLQVLTAADYYTMNKTLMKHVPPVLVDIILDPYMLNILPRSLIPTGAYIITISVLGWFLAKVFGKWLQMVGRADDQKKDI